MKYVKVSKESEINVGDKLGVYFEYVGDKLVAVRVCPYEEGTEEFRIAIRDWSTMQVEKEAPPETKDQYTVTGDFLGAPVEFVFYSQADAEHKHDELIDHGVTNVELKFEKVPVYD